MSGLVIVRTEEDGAVRLEDPLLWIGPDADDDFIATIACRRILKSEGVSDEGAVLLRVEFEGFAYRLAPIALARTRSRRRRSVIPV